MQILIKFTFIIFENLFSAWKYMFTLSVRFQETFRVLLINERVLRTVSVQDGKAPTVMYTEKRTTNIKLLSFQKLSTLKKSSTGDILYKIFLSLSSRSCLFKEILKIKKDEIKTVDLIDVKDTSKPKKHYFKARQNYN